jgi:hypothetical protein
MKTLLLPSIVAIAILSAGCPSTPTAPPAASPTVTPMTSGTSGTPSMTHSTSASATEKAAPVLDAFPQAKAVKVTASVKGFTPAMIHAKKGEPIAIELTRIDDKTCATEAVFPDLGIEAKLPLNQPVRVSFKPESAGEIGFQCGMAMLHGKVVVAEK